MLTAPAYILFFIAWALLCTAAQLDALTWRTVKRRAWGVIDRAMVWWSTC